MKQRAAALSLTVALALALCACGKKEAAVAPPPSAEPSVTATPTAEISPTPTAEPSAGPTPTAEPDDTIPSEDMEVFRAFLRGEISAVAGEDFYNDMVYVGYDIENDTWLGAKTMSIQDFTELVKDSFDNEDMEGIPETTADYTILKTMSGRPMLVVRYDQPVGFEIFISYFVFGNYDGQLRLTYAEDCWTRSSTELYEGLIFSGGGSGGAGDHYFWCGYIDEDGHYQRVYDGELLSGLWVAMDAYEIFDLNDIDWSDNCLCCLLTTDDGQFYDLDAVEGTDLADVDQEKLALLRQYYADKGFVEIDDAEKIIADAEAAHGIDPDAPVVENWTPLELPK